MAVAVVAAWHGAAEQQQQQRAPCLCLPARGWAVGQAAAGEHSSTACPPCAIPAWRRRRAEIAAGLQAAGLDLAQAPQEVLDFLSQHPQLLAGAGAERLRAALRLFATWRLPPPLCPLLLARCPALLKEGEAQLQVRGWLAGAWAGWWLWGMASAWGVQARPAC